MTLILTVMKKCINNENDTKNYSNNKSTIVIICYYMLLYNNCDSRITWYDNNKASTFDISTRCLGGAPPFSRPRCASPPPSSAGSGLGYWSFVGRPRCHDLRLRNRKHLGTFDNIWYDMNFMEKDPKIEILERRCEKIPCSLGFVFVQGTVPFLSAESVSLSCKTVLPRAFKGCRPCRPPRNKTPGTRACFLLAYVF